MGDIYNDIVSLEKETLENLSKLNTFLSTIGDNDDITLVFSTENRSKKMKVTLPRAKANGIFNSIINGMKEGFNDSLDLCSEGRKIFKMPQR